MFGIEIRRKGDITSLYKDVNTTLQRAGVLGGIIPEHIQATSVAHSIQKMLSSPRFDICTIRDCSKLVGLVIPSERMSLYSTQHCIDWSEMLPEFREVMVAMVLDDFKAVLNPEKEVITDLTKENI
jgi:hypothetical protein